jgi:4-hydroxybenzoate polyprenyltransferase
MASLRVFLALSRLGGLPTVWSNCLAGWWLGGHGEANRLPWLMLGASLLYLGGSFLKDAWDAPFDRQFRRARPIPSGAVSAGAVLGLGLAWLVLGEACLFVAGPKVGCFGLGAILCAVTFDATHRALVISPVLLGGCRLFVYLAAAVANQGALEGWPIWCGLALALYVCGIRCLPRPAEVRGRSDYWPVLLLLAPILLALLMNVKQFRWPGLQLSAVVALWILYCLRYAYWPIDRDFGRAVSGLVAGIAFVDWLAVLDVPRGLCVVFLGFFAASLLLGRLRPQPE